MNAPAPDACPNSLHRRLTVALAPAADRSRLADELQGALVDTSGEALLLRGTDLLDAAGAAASLRAGDRIELRTRFEAAVGRADDDRAAAARTLEDLQARRVRLLEQAEWARSAVTELAAHRRLVEEARQVLDARAHGMREAQAALERVLEQRAAAAAAVEQADRELGDMTSAAMDEPGLRRELEVAMRSVREATAALRSASEELRTLEAEHDGCAAELAAATTQADDRTSSRDVSSEQIERVLDAYEAFRDSTDRRSVGAGPDPAAVELLQAWRDLNADFLEVRAGSAPVPTEDELRDAAADVDAAAVDLQRAEQQLDRRVLTLEERSAIDAAHAAVLAAEERIGRRFGGGAAQARLEEARAVEAALLEQHGFEGYLEVMLTGGRAGAHNPDLANAEQRYMAAVTKLERLQQASASPTIAYLGSERERLRLHTIDHLGVDPGDAAVELLGRHPAVPAAVVHELRDALANIGIHPVGTTLLDAAETWLGHQRAVADQRLELDAALRGEADRRSELEAQVDELEARVAAGRRAVAEAEENLELAQRSVDAFEAELTMRAGEDTKRLKRLAAAEQLRAQVDAVEVTLGRAEATTRAAMEQAMADHATAEVGFEQANAAVADLKRRARDLTAELPPEQRPEGELLDGLDQLAAALDSVAAGMQPDLDDAEASLAAATEAHEEALAALVVATQAADGPQRDDFVDGLTQLLSTQDPQHVLVLDDPFADLDPGARADLLTLLRDGSTGHQLVLLTEDPDVLGWAIELPAEVATAVPADALLARIRRQPTDNSVNLTDDDHATAARHAGRT